MAKDLLVGMVVKEVSAPLRADGGVATLIDVDGGVATVSYYPGHNADCSDCIMAPEDMREYLREALAVRAPYIDDVQIVVESEAPPA